ncbi:phosphopantetheine-binding protein [Bacillus sp. NPDC060175]|uniref:phosphopantetheine-binding protein n=1 Tax=Bacillus sp. NPDC060175 TaxID=3347061 RepID=UPI00366581C1
MEVQVKASFEEFTKAVVERLNLSSNQLERDALWVKDIGISSIDLVKIVMLIRQKFGVKIPTSSIGKIKTVNDAYKLTLGE